MEIKACTNITREIKIRQANVQVEYKAITNIELFFKKKKRGGGMQFCMVRTLKKILHVYFKN